MSRAPRILLKPAIASVWAVNGLVNKILGFVPRHRLIVGRILGDDISARAVIVIGVLEVLIALWVLSGIKPRLCAVLQAVTVASMNILEIILAPDLLLFGTGNVIPGIVFISLVLFDGFYPGENKDPET